MRRVILQHTNYMILGLAGLLAFSACSKITSPKLIAKTVPGVYEGSELGFKEVLDLKPVGEFKHEVVIDGKLKIAESGNWSFDVETGAIRLEPFTSFFDIDARKILREGTRNNVHVFFVMLFDDQARTISPSVDFEFRLLKTKSYGIENSTNKLVVVEVHAFETNHAPPTSAPR